MREKTVGGWFGYEAIFLKKRFSKQIKGWLESDTALRRRFFMAGENGAWVCREAAARDYLAKAEVMRDHLLTAYHLSSGLPGRSTEIASLRFSNRVNALRNFYVTSDVLYTISRYSKNTSRTQSDTYIARFMTPAVSKLFAIALMVIRPLELCFAKFLNDENLVISLKEFAF
ncbi:MAG TPA: hypothetical protein VGD31_08830, partial [Sphingobacteriaceae bacterium]